LGAFFDDRLRAFRVGCIALQDHSIGSGRPDVGKRLLGFLLARQVMDTDSLHTFLRQLNGNG
jgi:hypothetical protein